jgi:hypothetical protein
MIPHVSRVPRLLQAFVALLIVLGAAGHRASAQGSARAAPKHDDRAKRLDEMRQLAREFKVVRIEENNRVPVELALDPLHRWTDPTRQNSDGSLWAWRASGRPLAVLAIEPQPQYWSFEFVSLSSGRFEANNGRVRWAPRMAGVEFHKIPDAPAPAAGETERLRQMRDLAKRFTASEFWHVTSQHYPLRLLPQPIDRYSDANSGLVDGAVFIFANTTNPEILMLIEASRRGEGPPAWSYAAAPLTTAAPTLKLGPKDVWSSGSKFGYLAEEAYFFGRWHRIQSVASPSPPPPRKPKSAESSGR